MKRLLIILVSILAAIFVLLAGLGFFLEATFRPREAAEIAVAADLGYLQGRISQPTGWMPMVLPGIAYRVSCSANAPPAGIDRLGRRASFPVPGRHR